MPSKIILVLAGVFAATGCAVIFPPMEATAKQAESLQAVHEFEGLSQADLYERSLAWSLTRPDLRCRDLDAAKEMVYCDGLGSAPMDFGFERPFYYDMMIDVKDGRVRTRFEDIWGPYDSTTIAGPNMKLQWHHVRGYFDRLKADLFQFIGNPTREPWQMEKKAKDDW